MERAVRMISPAGTPRTLRTLWLCIFASAVLAAADYDSRARADDRAAQEALSHETWQIIFLDENRVGYSRSSITPAEENGRRILRCTSMMHMKLKRFGQELTMVSTLESDETPSGELLRFVYTTENPPADTSRTVGEVRGGELELTTTSAGRAQQSVIPWGGEVKAPAYQDRLLREHPLQPGETRDFTTYLPDIKGTTDVRITADRLRPTRLHDGSQRELLLVKIQQSALPGLTTRAWVDESGEILKSETPGVLGSTLITYTVDEAVALEALAGAELDLAVATLIPAQNSARLKRNTQRAVYQVTIEGADPSALLIGGPAQQVERTGPHSARLTVTAVAPPQTARVVRAEAKYTESSGSLQADDFQVREHARRAKGTELNPTRVALRMEKYVHERLTEKNFSTALASAAEVAKNLEGDCTEHAMLLAAMLRAEGIASRIAVGLVYVEGRSAFAGHMWTEAFLGGTWVPLDATVGRGGTGAGYIKLVESAFSDKDPAPVMAFLPMMQALGKMKIEVVEAKP